MMCFEGDLGAPGQPLAHVWSHTVGSGRARMALRADWQAQLARCRRELGIGHVRFHGLLDDDMAVLLTEQDRRISGFRNVDVVYDHLVEIGARPFVELSFMPTTLASGDRTVFSYHGNVTPPNDLQAWSGLVGALARHWLDRYGADEVRRWYFEVWNEPNLAAFWTGTQADYFALYGASARALKAVDLELRVGGPATADNAWIADFVAWCRKEGVPCDFVSTHHYPTDAFGRPGDDTETQLAAATPGILAKKARESRAAAGGLPLVYTEWCASSNPFFDRHDDPYTAAFLVKNMLDVADVVEGYSWWTFSDIFEENYFSSRPFHGGFGLLTVHGIAKPSYRAMQLLHRLGGERLALRGEHPTASAWAIGGRAAGGPPRDGATADRLASTTVVVANHAFPRHPIEAETVEVRLARAPALARATLRRIDADHANAKAAWQAMGEPAAPSREQVAELEAVSVLRSERLDCRVEGDALIVAVTVPPHGVAHVELDFECR